MFERYCSSSIIPIVSVNTEEEMRHVAELCLEFLPVVEVTMRTHYSYTALEMLAKEYPSLLCIAGTVITADQADKVVDLGAQVIVSPGFEYTLLQHAKLKGYHYIPGVATPAEIQQCLSYGYKYLKFFPASILGGVNWLKAIAPVYHHLDVKFMPTGGLDSTNIYEYLSQVNVFACAGSWLCSPDLLEQKKWNELRRRFNEAHDLIASL